MINPHFRERNTDLISIPSPFSKNSPRDKEKDPCRTALVTAAKRLAAVNRIFTLPGAEANCARLFRENWPTAKIVGIERQEGAFRRMPREELNLTVYLASFRQYVSGSGRLNKPGMKSGILYQNVDFEKKPRSVPLERFDLAFLDINDRADNPVALKAVASFIKDRTMPHAIVGVTLSCASSSTKENVIDGLQNETGLDLTDLDVERDGLYGPKKTMLFFIIERFDDVDETAFDPTFLPARPDDMALTLR